MKLVERFTAGMVAEGGRRASSRVPGIIAPAGRRRSFVTSSDPDRHHVRLRCRVHDDHRRRGPIYLNATVANYGSGLSDPIEFQVGGLKDYADVIGCVPNCSSSEFFGDYYLQFAQGPVPGGSVTCKVQFLATKLGVANWTIMMYDGVGDQFFVGNASTVIR